MKNMKIFAVADMEGITGVHFRPQTKPGTAEYEIAQDFLMNDLNAAIEGAFEGGATEFVIYDLHESGRNVDLRRLDRRAVLISGKPPVTHGSDWAMNSSYDALFIIGNHAKTYTENAVFPHAYSLIDAELSVNGISVGEIGMEAMIAGSYGVPLALVTGDEAAANEACELNDRIHTAAVKRDAGFGAAVCLPTAKTSEIIRRAAAAAVQGIGRISPIRVKPPYEIKISFNGEVYEALSEIEGIERDGNTFILKGESLHIIWEKINLCYSKDWLSDKK